MANATHSGKIALVTGANKGIGHEIALQLGTLGMTVIIGARDEKRGKDAVEKLKLQRIDAHFLRLDVADADSVRTAAQQIDKQFGKLDVLVNNAGIFLKEDGPPSKTSLDVVRKTFDTNFFGPVAIAHAMLPLLRKSDAGRIVNMSSSLGSIGLAAGRNASGNWIAYNCSKSALNAATVALANELRSTSIKVNAADPGYVDTDMTDHRGPRSVEQGAREPVRLATLGADGPTGGYFNDDGPLPW